MSFDPVAGARILDAALPQFAERGYENTSLEAIRHAAGVPRAALAAQFRTKAALFEMLLERELHRLRTAVIAAIPAQPADRSAGEAVAHALEALLAVTRASGPSWRLLLHSDFGSFGDRRATAELRATIRARLAWLLGCAVPLPAADRQTTAPVLAAMLAALVEAGTRPPPDGEPIPAPEEIGAALDRLIGAKGRDA